MLHSNKELAFKINPEEDGAVIVEADFVFDEVFENTPSLSFVGICRSTSRHMGLDDATLHRLAIVHTPKRNAAAVVDSTLGHMISLARGIPQSNRYIKDGYGKTL